jgi:hypothetical protein
MVNFETEKIFLKRIRDLQEDFDNRILDLKREFYTKISKEEISKNTSKINPIIKSTEKHVKIDTIENNKETNDDIFEILDEELYKNMKLEFNQDEDFMSYNHIIGYYSIEVQNREYWFKKIVFDHFNRLKEFFENNDLSFLDYQTIFDNIGIKFIKSKSERKNYIYKTMSFEELESKLHYYYSTNNKKWFRRYWKKIIEENPDKVNELKIEYNPMLTTFNII